MKYAPGGITAKTGEALDLEVAVKGVKPEPAPKPSGGGGSSKPSKGGDPNGGGAAPNGGGSDPGGDPAKPAADKPSSVRPDYPLLPEDLKAKYLKMSFTLDGEQISFELQHLVYQNLGIDKDKYMATKNVVVGLFTETKKKDPDLLKELCGELADKSAAFIMHCFSGKGSPDQIQAVLKLAGHFHKRLGSAWHNKDTLSDGVADFYQNNVGLDCSGFAGNYARAVGGTPLEPNTSISTFAAPERRRSKVDDIQPGDVICWGNKHIATIQGRRGDGLFDIVESNGDPVVKGLGNTVRELTETGGDSMKIRKQHDDGKLGSSEEVHVATIK